MIINYIHSNKTKTLLLLFIFIFLYTKYKMVSLQDLPKKVQYIIIDSKYVNGSNNTFSIDLTLESNLHNHGGFLWFNPVRPIVFAAGSSNLLQHNPDIQ